MVYIVYSCVSSMGAVMLQEKNFRLHFDCKDVHELHLMPAACHEIRLGEPLPYSLYNRNGMLLLKSGECIRDLEKLTQMQEEGLFRQAHSNESSDRSSLGYYLTDSNAFNILEGCKKSLSNLFKHVKHQRAQEMFVRQTQCIARHVLHICHLGGDGALASLHLDDSSAYIVLHSLHAAMTSAMVGYAMQLPEETLMATICAALTHDVALLDIQDTLDRQTTALTEKQKLRIRNHPLDGVALLTRLGVKNRLWLDIVGHHHERLDGSGYPKALAASRLKMVARLLAVSDCYSAMVHIRPYRKAMMSQQAMRQLLVDQADKLDSRLVEMLIKCCGMFPAGVIVRLANHEVAIVKQQQHNAAMPLVSAFVMANSHLRSEPLMRDCSEAEYAIKGIVSLNQYRGCLPMLRGLWAGQ